MYKISVPIMTKTLDTYNKDRYAELLHKMKVDTVFLCPSGDNNLWKNYDSELSSLKRNVDFMHENGFTVGVWVWTFAFSEKSEYTYMRNSKGVSSSSEVCPSDKQYRKRMGKFIQDAAKCGIDVFQFDDDFRYGHIDIGFGCLCENHLKLISELLGKDVTSEEMNEHLLFGGENEYRNAFIKANGIILEDFAREMREYLDEVNPSVRMGFCSCITSWDIDGTTPDRISKLLAGNTKPFYRLIGAPYWANERNWGNRLADVIELERIETSRRKDNNIEIFSEGDTYPRPRYKVPSSYLEIFDSALRVAGCTDGILKYAFDYSASPDYEPGYINSHVNNQELYKDIDTMFSDKSNVGIRVWDNPERYRTISIPKKSENSYQIQDIAFSASSRMLNCLSVPATHEGTGFAGIAFGEDIRIVPKESLNDGLILDIDACRILKEYGVDTGIKDFGEEIIANEEIFTFNNEHIGVGNANFTSVNLDKKAVIESCFVKNGVHYPASYRYENENGQRFLVFCFNGFFNDEALFRQYTRAEQINNAVKWLCGKNMPVICKGNPDLYIQAKRNQNGICAGLWNICADKIDKPIIELDFCPDRVKTINCKAEIEDNKIKLTPLSAFEFCAFEAKKITGGKQ